MFAKNLFVSAALLVSAACSGGDVVGPPPPPPPKVCDVVGSVNYGGPLPCIPPTPPKTLSLSVIQPTVTTIKSTGWKTPVTVEVQVTFGGVAIDPSLVTMKYAGATVGTGTTLVRDYLYGLQTVWALAKNPETGAPDSVAVSFTVTPPANAVHGTVNTLNGGPCPTGLKIQLSKAGVASDSVTLTANGSTCTFSLNDWFAWEHDVQMVIPGTADFGTLARLVLGDSVNPNKTWANEQKFILASRAWKIAQGTYANQSVLVDLDWAYTFVLGGDGKYTSLFPRRWFNGVVYYANPLFGSFPVQVAFSRDGFASDSIWSRLRQLESELGMGNLFTQAKLSDLPVINGVRYGIVIVADDTATMAWGGQGSIVNGVRVSGEIDVPAKGIGSIGTAVTIPHEMGHVLGFQHDSDSPENLMKAFGSKGHACAKEAAHFQFLYAVFKKAMDTGTDGAMAAIAQGREYENGRPVVYAQ